MQGQIWQAEGYARNARFVSELGRPVLALLDPKPGERILDLGCGDGALTAEIRAAGAEVLGVDHAPDMVRAARERGLAVELVDAFALPFRERFHAVFSNAAIHWMKRDPDAVVAGVARALLPGGRFVGEFGGFGNVAAIVTALLAMLERHGIDGRTVLPWYFPSPAGWREKLERHGFEIRELALIPRPTALPTGMTGWLDTFAGPLFAVLPEAERPAARAEVVELLRPALCDERGGWIADYVRLRFAARLGTRARGGTEGC